MKRDEQVVKVQAALNQPGQVLIYNRNKTVMQQGFHPEFYKQIMDALDNGQIDLPKLYCIAKVTGKEINLRGPHPNQDPGW